MLRLCLCFGVFISNKLPVGSRHEAEAAARITMTEAEVSRVMREHLEGLFPRDCPNCHRQFATLRDYLLITKHVGPALSYDADLNDWNPPKPLGTITCTNCPCGNTLALSSEGIPLLRLWSLLNWARAETQERQMTPQELLNYLRGEICKQVLNAPGQGML